MLKESGLLETTNLHREDGAVPERSSSAELSVSQPKAVDDVRRGGGPASIQAGVAVGSRAVARTKDAGRVVEAIERTHTRQVGQATVKRKAIKDVASKVKTAADRAAVDGGRGGGMEQLKGHFIEILDVDTYNAKNKLTGKRLVPRVKGNAEAYDATRFINDKFAGGIQQKASASHVEKTIKAMEKKKPGSAKKGILRVPKDQVEASRRKAGGRVKEVKGMEFTRAEATKRLETGVGDVASKGVKAASQTRALGKAGAAGAATSMVIGSLTDIQALRRGDLTGRDYAEYRALDAAEGATGAVLGTAATGLSAAGATAALGTTAGASLVASAGAAGTAAITAVGGMGSAGAAVAGLLGGVTATAALPAVAGAGAAIGTGMIVGKGFRHIRKVVAHRQRGRRHLTGAGHRLQLQAGPAPGIDATSVDLVLRGRTDFTGVEARVIREYLDAIAAAPSQAVRLQARLRRLGFYVSDWSARGDGLTAEGFDHLVSNGLIGIIEA